MDTPPHDTPHDTPQTLPFVPDLSRIVIATGNPHKVEELRQMLALPGVEFVGLKELPDWEGFVEPEETGQTFEANAAIKALSYAEQTGMPCLADDSGLEVDALGGAPGVISSHYCTEGREVGMPR
ncbi:Nucleoside 5-triphosphatase RdgB (dHAPTP, dITP, XTP-specific), partial [hydrothermal vent metagenome]